MKRKTLRIIDITLALLLPLILALCIVQEKLGGSPLNSIHNVVIVVAHLVLCLGIMTLIFYHLKAHFGSISRWKKCLQKGKHQYRILLIFCLLTLLSGLLATIAYFSHGHTSIGGIHGVIGFIALALMALHLVRRRHHL